MSRAPLPYNPKILELFRNPKNLGKMEDVEYMQKKLYKALGVPVSRIEPQNAMFNGRSTEITRDEIKFFKFISYLSVYLSPNVFIWILRPKNILR